MYWTKHFVLEMEFVAQAACKIYLRWKFFVVKGDVLVMYHLLFLPIPHHFYMVKLPYLLRHNHHRHHHSLQDPRHFPPIILDSQRSVQSMLFGLSELRILPSCSGNQVDNICRPLHPELLFSGCIATLFFVPRFQTSLYMTDVFIFCWVKVFLVVRTEC